MWPALKSIVKQLPSPYEVVQGTLYRETVCTAFYWDGQSAFPRTNSEGFLLSALPEHVPDVLRWQKKLLSNMTALLTFDTLPPPLCQELAQNGISVILVSPHASLSELTQRINAYILNFVVQFFRGEYSDGTYPLLSSLYFTNHFENILNGLPYVDAGAEYGNEHVQLFPQGPYVMMILEYESSSDSPSEEDIVGPILSALDQVLNGYSDFWRIPVSVRSNTIVLMLPLRKLSDQQAFWGQIPKIIGQIRAKGRVDHLFSRLCGTYSPIFHEYHQIFPNYQQCVLASTLYSGLYGSGFTICSDFISLDLHLLQALGLPHISTRYEKCFSLLQNYDIANKTDLVGTLTAYLKYNGKLAEAAASLEIHRNTLRNRLDVIERLLGLRLSDPENFFYLNMCLRISIVSNIASNLSYFSSPSSAKNFNESTLPVSREIRLAYDLLSRYDSKSAAVLALLRKNGLEHVSINRAEVEGGHSDFLRILIPGFAGKSAGKSAPTIGVIGRLSGIKLQNQPLSLVSDADSAIAAIALALNLAALRQSGNGPMGDVIITTQLALQSSSAAHFPAALTASPVGTDAALRMEVDAEMDAVISISVARATNWVNNDGIAITPTVKGKLILPPSDKLLYLMETITGRRPVVFPLTSYDLTPVGNGLYHANTMMQPALVTDSPVVGVALTSANLVPGITPRHNALIDVEQAIRFVLEVILGFTAGEISLYNQEEFNRAEDIFQ